MYKLRSEKKDGRTLPHGAREAIAAWANFVRTGRPYADGVPEWPAYDMDERATMMFDVQSHVAHGPLQEAREILAAAEEG